MATTYERFWAQVDRSGGPTSCWPWTGPRSPKGVPVFEVRRRRTTARRFAYRMQHGDPGPSAVVVTCQTWDCLNFRHMTIRSRRAIAITNGSAATRNAAVTACPAGHQLAGPNLYRHPGSGRRECALCKLAARVTRPESPGRTSGPSGPAVGGLPAAASTAMPAGT